MCVVFIFNLNAWIHGLDMCLLYIELLYIVHKYVPRLSVRVHKYVPQAKCLFGLRSAIIREEPHLKTLA